MKKLTVLFILSITAYCGRLEASGLPAAWSEADLASVFDSGARPARSCNHFRSPRSQVRQCPAAYGHMATAAMGPVQIMGQATAISLIILIFILGNSGRGPL